MNKYFRSAVDRFNKKFKKESFISPISEKDVKIIEYIKVALEESPAYGGLIAILDEWKGIADEEILGNVENWLVETSGDDEEEGEEKEESKLEKMLKRPPIVVLNGERIQLQLIYSYAKYELYDDNGDFDSYCIKLNETPEEVKRIPLFANYLVKFYDEDLRDETIEKLDKWFKEFNTNILK